ncbi:hypothetical protein [Fibrella forsythiae]|uniref:Uncharacterized protein n=1 Tax=Fibrella forsythiae TaxID=2817061 RepID=A0ABS3JSA1_9BACT|nr:hypothetical protein [Fibrella forsythiae]MBO0952894.1 hypothetical protein [Fibrella forsythiae]
MLKEIWEVDYLNRTVSLKTALESLSEKNLKRLYYWDDGTKLTNLLPVIKETLYKQGFLLIQNDSRMIPINKAPQSSYNILKALQTIAQLSRNVELRNLNHFHSDDFAPEEDKSLHHIMYEVALEIKQKTRIIIKFCKLGSNKLYIPINNVGYINSEDKVIEKINKDLSIGKRKKDHIEFFFEIFLGIDYL